MDQWNGQWPPQSNYWSTPYNYGSVQPVSQSQQQDTGYSVTTADRTPPPPRQDATPPPPAAEDSRGVHQPRIQQYSQTGYPTELPAVAQPPPAPPLPPSATPTLTVTYAEKKEGSLPTQHSELSVVKKGGGLLPLPDSQPQSQHTVYHQLGSQYGQPWERGRERADVQPPIKKRRSRWEQQPESEIRHCLWQADTISLLYSCCPY